MFKGYVVRNWFDINPTNKYYQLNKIIVKKYDMFYHRCQIDHNNICHSPLKQNKVLKLWCIEIKEIANNKGGNTKRYIDMHPINETNMTISYIKNWIRNMQVMIKLNQENNGQDIQQYLVLSNE